MHKTSNVLPLFIEAPSKQELVRLMFENNVKFGTHFQYFDIQKDGKMWVAWYYARIDGRAAIK